MTATHDEIERHIGRSVSQHGHETTTMTMITTKQDFTLNLYVDDHLLVDFQTTYDLHANTHHAMMYRDKKKLKFLITSSVAVRFFYPDIYPSCSH